MGKPQIASEFEIKPYRTFPLWVHYMMRKFNADKKNCYQIFGFDYVRMNAWKGSKSIPTLKSCMRLSKYLSEYTGVTKYDVLDSILESIPEWRNM